jgi:hypothetical protein
MSNQMNVHFINQEKMLAARVGDVFSGDRYETSLPVDGGFDEPLLDFLRKSLMEIGEEDEDALSDVEYELLDVVQEDWNPEAVTWVITFQTSWAVDEDLRVIRQHLEGPVKERLPGPDLEGGDFPASIPEQSPFRAFDFAGWQFFDREEFDAIIQGLLRAREEADEMLGDGLLHDDYEEEWNEVLRDWQDGGYDLALFWWLV